VLSGRGLYDDLITRLQESYRLCCVVVCDLETSRIGAPYTYDISNLRVNLCITYETWGSIYLSGDIDITFNAFLFTFLHFESSFPVQYVNPKKKTNKLITKGKKTCKTKQSCYMICKCTNAFYSLEEFFSESHKIYK
jgi:hypothetical protein